MIQNHFDKEEEKKFHKNLGKASISLYTTYLPSRGKPVLKILGRLRA